MWLDLAGWYLHLCMLKMDVPKHEIFPYLSLLVSHVMHRSRNIKLRKFRSPKNRLHRLGEKLKALLQLHTGSRSKVLLLQASITINDLLGLFMMFMMFIFCLNSQMGKSGNIRKPPKSRDPWPAWMGESIARFAAVKTKVFTAVAEFYDSSETQYYKNIG